MRFRFQFPSLSKNNMGVVAMLLFAIIVSQWRMLPFLMDTVLGRTILILFILGVSCANKILGIVSILIIIILFNQSDFGMGMGMGFGTGMMEGFDVSGNDPSGNPIAQMAQDKLLLKQKELQALNQHIQQTATTTSSVSSTTTPTTTTSTTSSESFKGGMEGFNMIEREDNILRGKRSNDVPVFDSYRSQNDNVEPTDMSVFSGGYSSF